VDDPEFKVGQLPALGLPRKKRREERKRRRREEEKRGREEKKRRRDGKRGNTVGEFCVPDGWGGEYVCWGVSGSTFSTFSTF
jgi:hypothetical protein